jgi:hypothetical protein
MIRELGGQYSGQTLPIANALWLDVTGDAVGPRQTPSYPHPAVYWFNDYYSAEMDYLNPWGNTQDTFGPGTYRIRLTRDKDLPDDVFPALTFKVTLTIGEDYPEDDCTHSSGKPYCVGSFDLWQCQGGRPVQIKTCQGGSTCLAPVLTAKGLCYDAPELSGGDCPEACCFCR